MIRAEPGFNPDLLPSPPAPPEREACPGLPSRVLLPFVSPVPPPAPEARFAGLIAALCEAVGARVAGPARPGLAGPLIILIWTRLRRMADRITRLAARAGAGTLPPPRSRPATPRRKASPPYQRLPRGVAWLVRMVPAAAFGAGQLEALLADPGTKALIEAAPQIGRTLRPLCRMLGVDPPPALRRPPPAPPRPAEAGRSPPQDSRTRLFLPLPPPKGRGRFLGKRGCPGTPPAPEVAGRPADLRPLPA